MGNSNGAERECDVPDREIGMKMLSEKEQEHIAKWAEKQQTLWEQAEDKYNKSVAKEIEAGTILTMTENGEMVKVPAEIGELEDFYHNNSSTQYKHCLDELALQPESFLYRRLREEQCVVYYQRDGVPFMVYYSPGVNPEPRFEPAFLEDEFGHTENDQKAQAIEDALRTEIAARTEDTHRSYPK